MVYGSFALVLSGLLYLLAAVLRRADYRLLRDTELFDFEAGQVSCSQRSWLTSYISDGHDLFYV